MTRECEEDSQELEKERKRGEERGRKEKEGEEKCNHKKESKTLV